MVMNKKRGKGKRGERGSLPCTVCVSRHWLLGYELVPLHLRVLLFRSQKNSKKRTGEKKKQERVIQGILQLGQHWTGGNGCWQQQDPGGQKPTSLVYHGVGDPVERYLRKVAWEEQRFTTNRLPSEKIMLARSGGGTGEETLDSSATLLCRNGLPFDMIFNNNSITMVIQ
ncbi:uncharacterized protein BDCG_03104 [Blastomyces dermatitidis ER-3]|uniref:Uncharacterized protein n=1 Tax=Ajellomyces dermatitidis (strain ER-3 / ATCC MYA-2586) TaxID=559297 RepID=A0ABX2VTR4_AJEDR|nr:uncharacterized protein BDCG_03104 [Blastomyces dermatitidis ER-3]OAT00580.1 hypothetical protein BDCG_03104 [Blastomyces dermatitidis ER-3]